VALVDGHPHRHPAIGRFDEARRRSAAQVASVDVPGEQVTGIERRSGTYGDALRRCCPREQDAVHARTGRCRRDHSPDRRDNGDHAEGGRRHAVRLKALALWLSRCIASSLPTCPERGRGSSRRHGRRDCCDGGAEEDAKRVHRVLPWVQAALGHTVCGVPMRSPAMSVWTSKTVRVAFSIDRPRCS
jgi:hypothetical protein